MARDYAREYQQRRQRAVEQGYSGYGQQRRSNDVEITRIMETDPIFRGLPDEYQTRANAVLYRQGFFYVGRPTKAQKAARKRLLKISGGAGGILDIETWAEFYKNVIYPSKTGQEYPGFTPIQRTTVENMTPAEFDRLFDME